MVQFKDYGRRPAPGTKSQLCTLDVETGAIAVVLETGAIAEAANWTPDGASLLFNAGGELWLVPAAGGDPAGIDTGGFARFNNDHVVAPDGSTVYASHDDGHIYAVAIAGGAVRRVTGTSSPHLCYLHGVAPDGATLAYVGVEETGGGTRTNLFKVPAAGGAPTRLTDSDLPHDGPEFSPDGAWLYFNAERNSPGHAQCFRMRPDGSGVEQITFDERVNWFPHLSPDGRHLLVLSYPPGTAGHPADKPVILRLAGPDGSGSRNLVALRGGQGTINVNSWAPDSRRFAFFAYPPTDAAGPLPQNA